MPCAHCDFVRRHAIETNKISTWEKLSIPLNASSGVLNPTLWLIPHFPKIVFSHGSGGTHYRNRFHQKLYAHDISLRKTSMAQHQKTMCIKTVPAILRAPSRRQTTSYGEYMKIVALHAIWKTSSIDLTFWFSTKPRAAKLTSFIGLNRSPNTS